jgi:hypothetical protein
MNDIADTSVRIQTSAEDRLFEKRARSEKFFSCPHAMLAKASNVRHVEPSREETRRALSSHMNTRSIGETWRHRLSPIIQPLIRSAFHEKNNRLIIHYIRWSNASSW